MRIPLFTAVLVLVIGCAGKNRVPPGILPPEKMEMVLWDMIQADAFLKDYILKDSALNDTTESIRMYERVLQMHQTTRGAFDTSFAYYRQRPQLIKEVLDTLYARSLRMPLETYPVVSPEAVTAPDTVRVPLLRKKKMKPE